MPKDTTTAAANVWERAQQERNWCVFAITAPDPETGKRGKFPTVQDRDEYRDGSCWGNPASVYSAARFTYDEATRHVQTLTPCGEAERYMTGYLPRPGSALVLCDLDACRDPVTGHMADWAMQILAQGDTYYEASTSGTGIRVIAERMDGDDEISSGERNDVGFFANGGRGAVLTFDAINAVPITQSPGIRDAVLERRGTGRRDNRDRVTNEDYGDVDPDLLRAVVMSIPNDGKMIQYDDWIILGHAIQSVDDGPAGYEIFRDWSDQWPSKRTESIEKKWHTGLDANGEIGFGTLVYMARSFHGGKMPGGAEKMLTERIRAHKAARALEALPEVKGDAQAIRIELAKLIDASPVAVDLKLKELKGRYGIGLGALRTELASLRTAAAGESNDEDLAHFLARSVLHYDFEQGRHLMFLQDDKFWRYDVRVWVRISEKQISGVVTKRAQAMVASGELFIPPTRSMTRVVTEAEKLLRGMVARTDDPLRLMHPPPNMLNCRNCVIDLDRWAVIPHDPALFLRIAIDVDYEPEAVAPRFEAAVTDMFNGDAEMYRHLCEVLAMIMSPRKFFAAMVMFVGNGSNGKTIILRVIHMLLGGSVRPCDIHLIDANNFSSNQMVGATALLDDDLDYHTELPIAALKKYSEPKMVGAEAKYGEQYQFHCEVTPVMASNDYPPVRDSTFGFVRRINVIEFNQTYHLYNQAQEYLDNKGNSINVDLAVEDGTIKLADETLNDTLQKEAPGILNMILLALVRVKQRGSFTEPPQVQAAKDRWRNAADSVRRFIEDSGVYRKELNASTDMATFRRSYMGWCEANRLKPKGERQITASLKSNGYNVTKTQGVQMLRGFVLSLNLPVN